MNLCVNLHKKDKYGSRCGDGGNLVYIHIRRKNRIILYRFILKRENKMILNNSWENDESINLKRNIPKSRFRTHLITCFKEVILFIKSLIVHLYQNYLVSFLLLREPFHFPETSPSRVLHSIKFLRYVQPPS